MAHQRFTDKQLGKKTSLRAGFFEGDIAFDIYGTGPPAAPVPIFVSATKACLTRGAPTRPSPFLEGALGFSWEAMNRTPLYLRPQASAPTWSNTIRGSSSGDNPALSLFEKLLPKLLGEWAFVTELIIPEFPLFSRLLAPSELFAEPGSERVDFYLPQARLVIEVDGRQHQRPLSKTLDDKRDQFLHSRGIKTLRIPTNNIRQNGKSLGRLIERMISIFESEPELAAYIDQTDIPKDQNLRIEITAAMRLQLALITLIETGHLPLDGSDWRLRVMQDFAEGENQDWAKAAAADLNNWFECFADIYQEQFRAPVVDWASDGVVIENLLLHRADEKVIASEHTVITTAAIQKLPLEGGRAFLSDPNAKPTPINLKNLPETCSSTALERLNRLVFGHESFKPGQLELLQNIFTGGNSLGLMPTGAGKSLTFQLPNLLCPGTTVVIVPIKALGRDHTAELDQYGFSGRSVNIDSSTAPEERELNYEKIRRGCYRFVFVSPERFQMDDFKSVVKTIAASGNLNFFGVDEAHCLSEWGHDFRPSYLTLPSTLKTLGPTTPVICVTATAAVNTLKDLQTEFNISDEMISYEMHRGRPELTFGVKHTKAVMGDLIKLVQSSMARFPSADANTPPGLIFSPYVNGETGALAIITELALKLPQLRLALFTGKKPQETDTSDLVGFFRSAAEHITNYEDYKVEVQRRWKRGEIDLVVATKAFGMGVNKANVRFTIHAGMPSSMEAFYQEAGRAGRDGSPATGDIIFKKEPDKVDSWFANIQSVPEKSAIDKCLDKVDRWERGDLRAQLWFLNTTNSDTSVDLVRLEAIRAILPAEGGTTIIDRECHKTVIADGHTFQVALFRLYQLGLVRSWSIRDWGIAKGGVLIAEVQSSPVDIEQGISSLRGRIQAITGKGESLTKLERARHEIVSEQDPTKAWGFLFSHLLGWIQRSQVRSRLQSMRRLYDHCADFTPKKAHLFKEDLQNYFSINRDSLTLSQLKDLTIDQAPESIAQSILTPKGVLKPQAALRKLESQVARLREGTTESPALNLAAGILKLTTKADGANDWEQLLASATGNKSRYEFWFGEGKNLMRVLCLENKDLSMELAKFLLSEDLKFAQLQEMNIFFKNKITRMYVLRGLATQFATEI